jgi:hypothetical protein
VYCISTRKVAKAWEDVTEKCINGDMNRIWPKHVHNLKGFNTVIPAANKEILGMDGHVRLSELEQNSIHVYC